MSRGYYDLLGVPADAPLDEIKKAFRREIAKYHPDKVQHLGHEFQEIAAVKAAELTQAYKTLSDASLRAAYDADLGGGHEGGGQKSDPRRREAEGERERAPEPPPRAAAQPAAATAERVRGDDALTTDRTGAGELLRRAALGRFRQAVAAEFGQCDEAPLQGFDFACAPPKARFWSKLRPRILVRVVPHVDGGAVAETWTLAARMPRDRDADREVCIFLMGPAVAPAGELARAIAEGRRKPAPHKLFLVPLNTRTWAAHIPADAPGVVKTLVNQLRSQ